MNFETFQMIQHIVEFDCKRQVICCYSVAPTESTIFDYHFRDFAVIPGALLTETIAQAAGHLSLLTCDFKQVALFSSIDKARFREFVLPGDELTIQCQCTQQGSGYSAYSGAIYVKDKKCIEAKFRLREMPFPNEKMKQHLKSLVMSRINENTRR
ncbi:3-hydroxyacyl-ACP dehydratase FabZ family protein [Agarilytica rhodophyticola]|uniref:3-hydroxyacyl-ACP dehydratase FabZ family protein n=1 Tax=Agarilytica rhodophyticola TaxID=1737490 RepID=UPI000B341ECA|nr:3-hydroxyacyl-ACP dehydratase FabZ family protein [Agarilytica rhodophyticola]